MSILPLKEIEETSNFSIQVVGKHRQKKARGVQHWGRMVE